MTRELNPIVSMGEDDYVFGVWFGSYPEGSLMVTLYRLEDQRLYARGRVRVHMDDKLMGSADEKHVIEVPPSSPGASPEIFKGKVQRRLRRLLRELKGGGLTYLPVHGHADALVGAMERHAMKSDSLRVSITKFDQEPGA
jgi:hypothetical protein